MKKDTKKGMKFYVKTNDFKIWPNGMLEATITTEDLYRALDGIDARIITDYIHLRITDARKIRRGMVDEGNAVKIGALEKWLRERKSANKDEEVISFND